MYSVINLILLIAMVEISAFTLKRIFQPMRVLEFIIGHMVYYIQKRPNCKFRNRFHFDHAMGKFLPKTLDLLKFSVYSLNFSLDNITQFFL